MSNPDDAFVQATDNLLVLYRNLERHTLDLPLVSVLPVLIFFWSVVKFEFFLIIGIVLIIPVNFVILVRNLFPGHWRYRPFFSNSYLLRVALALARRSAYRTIYIYPSPVNRTHEGAL
jgi:hypothetical protein